MDGEQSALKKKQRAFFMLAILNISLFREILGFRVQGGSAPFFRKYRPGRNFSLPPVKYTGWKRNYFAFPKAVSKF